jgi:hypothetical protein
MDQDREGAAVECQLGHDGGEDIGGEGDLEHRPGIAPPGSSRQRPMRISKRASMASRSTAAWARSSASE